MVITTSSLLTAGQRGPAGSGTTGAVFEAAKPEVSAFSYPSVRIQFNTVQREYPDAAPEVVFARDSLVTSPEVSKDLQIAAKADVLVLRPGARLFSVAPNVASPALVSLPKTKISTAFEPHLRQLAVKRIQDLMSEFRHSIGRPDVATVREELRGALIETYKQAAVSPETRSFATAISLLQDFLRPHWSTLPGDQLTEVDARLSWLSSQHDLSTSTLTRFYRDLVGVLKAPLSLAVSTEPEDEDDDESDE